MSFARTLIALSFCACTTTGSPLSRISPQVEVQSNPGGVAGVDYFTLSMTTWVDLDVLGDAIEAGSISATVDGDALAIDQGATGYRDGRDSYVATFELAAPRSASPHPASSQISISDGETTWSAEIAALFVNDLAAAAPMTAGENTFVWPSAASPSAYSTIDWACVDVAGQSSACGGAESDQEAVGVSQQFITATVDGAPGTSVSITAERSVDAVSSDDGPTFLVRIDDQLATTL
ncbi:MAG TPA: hypothetical protein VGG74_37775 [Kofleriaceae bacterium]|jgi:hypothetical protein